MTLEEVLDRLEAHGIASVIITPVWINRKEHRAGYEVCTQRYDSVGGWHSSTKYTAATRIEAATAALEHERGKL